ncbi:MAG: hypothetical protein ACI9BW_003449 [Gammaproteobacteria bacterium]|jgi:hypothetical protein
MFGVEDHKLREQWVVGRRMRPPVHGSIFGHDNRSGLASAITDAIHRMRHGLRLDDMLERQCRSANDLAQHKARMDPSYPFNAG